MGAASSGIVRAEGQLVTSTQSTDLFLIQTIDSTTGQYSPREITANNALASGLKVQSSSSRIGTATLVAGTVTVSNTTVTANTRIFLTTQSLGTVTAPKAIAVTAKTANTSFVITSADNTDTSVIGWLLVESV